MNKPPAAASKIVTDTTSPMPNLILGGGLWSGNEPASAPGPYSLRMSIAMGLSFTNPKSGPETVWPDFMETSCGPELGMIEQPAEPSNTADNNPAKKKPRTTQSFLRSDSKFAVLPQYSQRSLAQPRKVLANCCPDVTVGMQLVD